jgi:endonuclease YncB( thermonuclease family)
MAWTDNEATRNLLVGLVAGFAMGGAVGIGVGVVLDSDPLPPTAAVPVESATALVSTYSPTSRPATLANVILGKVVGIADGDTLTVLDGSNTQYKIRLEGIDAPESHQAFGTQAKKALSDFVFNRAVRVQWAERDKYGRTLGHVYSDDRWINKAMVQNGWAWHYVEYSDDEVLAESERGARLAKAGLWRDARPVAPWDFRHNPELAATALASDSQSSRIDLRDLGAMPLADASSGRWQDDPILEAAPTSETVYITNSGGKYHRGGCRYLSKSRIPIALDDAAGRYTPCSVCNPPTGTATALAAAATTSDPWAAFPEAATETQTESVTVYATRSGGKYHRAGCRYLKSSIPMSLDAAKARYSPCSVCNPPY